MKGDRGQISPITVRAKLFENNKIQYDVIDGFHRVSALKTIGRRKTKAVVVYGCSDEELFDLRVLAANSVKSVQFARIAKWMQFSFEQTSWHKRGLTLSQACSIVIQGSTRSRFGLSSADRKELKNWLTKKSVLWHQPINTILQRMRLVESAAPDLVEQVRIGRGGKEGSGVLNPARLQAIVHNLEGEWDLQRLVAKVVLSHDLIAQETAALSKSVADVKHDPGRVEKIITDPLRFIPKRLQKERLRGLLQEEKEGFYAVGGGDRKLQHGDPRLTRLSFLEKEEINLREKIQKLEYDLSNLQRKLDQANSVAEESSLSSKFWQKKAAEDQASLEIWKKRAHERLDRIIKAQNRIEELEEVLEQNQISISSRQDESQETNTVS